MIDSNDIDRIAPGVWVGPHLFHPDSVEVLAAVGIDAVLSLQTEDDLQVHGVDSDTIEAALHHHGIVLHRAPIRDFDEEDLIRRLPGAVATLQQLVAAGHQTYVHCTAGVGRSPAVVLGYLIYSGSDVADAEALLMRQHPASKPNTDAVRRALGV